MYGVVLGFAKGVYPPRGGAPCCGVQSETAAGDACPRRHLLSVLREMNLVAQRCR
jgi:hypothetical protein